MAIKILNNINIEKYNLLMSNIILSFKGTYRVNYLTQNEEKIYTVNSILYYYIDRNKDPIYSENHSYAITEQQLNNNLLEYMYTMLKNKYVNIENL
jgi:hypothetical protein